MQLLTKTMIWIFKELIKEFKKCINISLIMQYGKTTLGTVLPLKTNWSDSKLKQFGIIPKKTIIIIIYLAI